MRRLRLAAAAVAVAVLVTLTAACGDSGESAAGTTTTSATAPLDGATTTSAAAPAASTTSAPAASVTLDAIVADLPSRIGGDIGALTIACPPGHGGAVRAGDIYNCVATPADPAQDGALVFVVVVDDNGSYAVDFGTGIPAGADEIAAAGASCQDLLDAGQPYFYAVAYWFDQHAPASLDPDANGRPCDIEYPTDAVAQFWDSASAPPEG